MNLNRLLDPLRRRVATLISRAVLAGVNAAPGCQTLQVTILADEPQTDVEHMEPYGFTSNPLPLQEVAQIAKSIHKWITTKSRIWRDGQVIYEANFIAIQSARGRKGGRGNKRDSESREVHNAFTGKFEQYAKEVLGQ